MIKKSKLGFFWGKTDKKNQDRWNPLLLHLIDVAAVADAVLLREPASTRLRMAQALGLEWHQALPWIRLIIACHDIGKACPGFQLKWIGSKEFLKEMELNIPCHYKTDTLHGSVSQIALNEFLVEKGWSENLSEKIAAAVGCHHGERATPNDLYHLEGDRKALGDNAWKSRRKEIFQVLLEIFNPTAVPKSTNLSGADFMLYSGLTSFADWIGSNEEWFSFGTFEDTLDLNRWWVLAKERSQSALDAIGWEMRTSLSHEKLSFREVFNQTPRPLQDAVAKVLKNISEPSILLVEAPMGEGKTEAAFYAHLELQRRLDHRGLYVALPTKATGNAMFKRTLNFLRLQGSKRPLDLQLLHGATLLNNEFQKLKLASIYTSEGNVRAAEWFTNKKRALLSEYGVGTVDQALLSILPVRHQFVRLWGLANRVVIFDEIHAYDAYTGTLLIELVRWLMALNSSVILLSATLPPGVRQKLAEVMNAEFPDCDVPYPRLTVINQGKMEQIPFQADPSRRCSFKIEGVSSDISQIRSEMEKKLQNGGLGLILVNTVQRAQNLYRLFSVGEPIDVEGVQVGKRLSDGTEIFLFHARFPANKKQKREDHILSVFGKEGLRQGRKILIATQVAEQSLDLDFDVIATDLAPIDLILQRAGRLWRHQRGTRPMPDPQFLVASLDEDRPPNFGEPLCWSAVYREDVLLRTWVLLKSKADLVLPDEIDELVQDVYEERVNIPDFLQECMDKALQEGEGKASAQRGQAHGATIGAPDDASWDEPARYTKYDDDDIRLHPSLIAKTRLGERSATVIPIFPSETIRFDDELTLSKAKALSQCAVGLSRKGIVSKLQNLGRPDSWQKSPLMRNCYPLLIDSEGRWLEDQSVRLDDELGIVYESKED